jgi:GAF domain-containing protein
MSSAFIQAGFTSSTAFVIALVVLVVAVGLMVFLFLRSSAQRRKRESRVRERMLEMEREAQFAAAADRVPISRNPADVARQIASLLREYISMSVLAVYSGRASDASLFDVLSSGMTESVVAPGSGLPDSVPASSLMENPRPAIVKLAAITGLESADVAVPLVPAIALVPEGPPAEAGQTAGVLAAEEAVAETQPQTGVPVAEKPRSEDVEQHFEANSGADRVEESKSWVRGDDHVSPVRSGDYVMLLPWRGPFGWNGLIVAPANPRIALEALDPYREPLARLTDRLAVALEFEHSDAVTEAHHQLALLTTDFSRSVISCMEEASPLDAIVREVTKLVSSDSAALWRVDETSGMVRMVAAHGLRSPEFLPLPVGQGLAGSVAKGGEVLAIEDAPADPRCIFPREARESGIVSYLGAPLAADGKTLGVIEVHCASRRSWTEGDQRALESAATIIAELLKSSDSRVNRLRVESAYLGLSESLQRLRSAEEVKEAVVEVLGHALAASRVIIVEFDHQDQPEPVKHEYRQPSAKSALGATFGETLFAGVAASVGGQPIAIADSQEQSLAGVATAAELGVLSELAAPIRVEGKTRAIVYVHQCDRVREWDHEEIEFAERVVRQLSLSLSNLRLLDVAFSDAQQARADAQRTSEIGSEAPARIKELEQKLEGIERALTQSRSVEEAARGMLAKASALEAKARAEADVSRRVETEVRQQLERIQEEHKQAQGSAQQLLEINRLKSEFIVNAGHEIEASLQSVLGLAELLERGSYGNLTPEQREAVHGLYGWARRIKSDVDALIEYGSARSRRLESSGAS